MNTIQELLYFTWDNFNESFISFSEEHFSGLWYFQIVPFGIVLNVVRDILIPPPSDFFLTHHLCTHDHFMSWFSTTINRTCYEQKLPMAWSVAQQTYKPHKLILSHMQEKQNI